MVIALKAIINIYASEYGVFAIAASTTVLFTLYALNIALAMSRVTGNYMDKALLKNVFKILISGACAFLVFVILKSALPHVTSGKLSFLVPLMICGGVYCGGLLVSGTVKVILKGTKSEE